MNTDEIERRAVGFVRDLTGPLGPKPLERVLRQHIALFVDLRAAGANWRQIAALMVKHGVRRRDGGMVDATQWAAMVSRIERAGTGDPGPQAIVPQPPPSRERGQSKLAAPGDTRNREEIRLRMRVSSEARGE